MASWFSKSGHPESSTEASVEPPPAAEEIDGPTPASIEADVGSGLITADTEEQLSSLALLSRAHQAIIQAGSVDELKDIRDKAEAARMYAQAAGMGLEIQNYAAEVKLRAERRAGSLIAKLNLHGGDRRQETAAERLSLGDIGVSKDQSSRWQLTASVPEKQFERYLERTREESGEVTTAGLVRVANELRAKQRQKRSDEPPSVSGCRVISSLDELMAGERKFACIYVDAPWIDEQDNEVFAKVLGQISVELLIEDNAHLHLWASNDSLFFAKQAMENWGFAFKGCLLCLNSVGKRGDYWVEAHEYLLLGVRGDLPLMERTMNSWMRCDRDQAGCPSPRIRKLIERVSPGPYLELYGRTLASGWTIYSSTLGAASPETQPTEGQSDAETTGA